MHLPEYKVLRVLDMSCTERELRRWLQVMARMYPLVQEGTDYAHYILPSGGTARIGFKELPMRVIALVRLPRMEVILAYSEQRLGQASANSNSTHEAPAHQSISDEVTNNQSLDIKYPAEEADAFAKTFLLYTQRGGG